MDKDDFDALYKVPADLEIMRHYTEMPEGCLPVSQPMISRLSFPLLKNSCYDKLRWKSFHIL